MADKKTLEHKDKNAPAHKKTKIPSNLRYKVWRKFNGDQFYGICLCCQSVINISSWHASHVISEHNGGSTNQDNLRPCCMSCNLSMGKLDMLPFMKQFGYQVPDNFDGYNNAKWYRRLHACLCA